MSTPPTQPETPAAGELILTVTRVRNRVVSQTHLYQLTPGGHDYLVESSLHPPMPLRADTPADAIAYSPPLHNIDIRDATIMSRTRPDLIERDALLDALRDHHPTAQPGDLDVDESDDPVGDERWPWDLEEAATRWSTWHRISLDDEPIFGTELTVRIRVHAGTQPRAIVFVHAEPSTEPFAAWEPLIALTWESSDYAAVGAAGYGTDGLFLIRPGLIANVHHTDEELEIHIERTREDTTPIRIIRPRLQHLIQTDAHRALLALASHGLDPSELMPTDRLTSTLKPAELHRLLRTRLSVDPPP